MLWKFSISLSSMIFLVTMSFLSLISSLFLLAWNHSIMIEWELSMINSSIIEFMIIIDWMSCMFLSFVLFISSMVLFYSDSYMHGTANTQRFMYMVLMFVLSMSLMILSPNLISILLGWDGLGLVSYALVIFYQNEKSSSAGMITVLSNRVGDVAILLSIALMIQQGSWNFTHYVEFLSDKDMILLKLLVILAACTKSAQMPFSAWLPAAMAAPTPVSALVHSSTLVTAGVYLLIRFSAALNGSTTQVFLLLLASLTMFMAGLGANFEYDLKKIIALSTLSQLGVMLGTLALGFPTLAFFHLLAHALFKALLFLCAGVIIHNVKEYQDIRSMGSLTGSMPLTMMCFNSANLALCGVPFLAGFYSKDLILETMFLSNTNMVIFWLFTIATIFTLMYSFRLLFISMTSIFKLGPLSNLSDKDMTMTSPMMILSMTSLSSGAVLSWLTFPDPYTINLPTMVKMLPIFIVLMGGFMGYTLSTMKFNTSSIHQTLFKHFSGSMWFLPQLSSLMLANPILQSGQHIHTSLDKGWSELSGAQGIYTNLMYTTKKIQTTQETTLKMFIMSFLFWTIPVLFMSL